MPTVLILLVGDDMTGHEITGLFHKSRHCRSLYMSTALAAILCLAPVMQPAQAQSVTVEGNVTPGGATSPYWGIRDSLTIGRSGAGSLTIRDGGMVEILDYSTVFIGYESGSQGTLTISGTDGDGNPSTLDTFSGMVVGFYGTGELNITNGGLLKGSALLGNHDGSAGRVNVNTGGVWQTNSGIVFGPQEGSTGELRVESGGQVSSAYAEIGHQGDGTAYISGVGSDGVATRWDIEGRLYVGANGSSGKLEIEDGAVVTAGWVRIADRYDSSGEVIVRGTAAAQAGSAYTPSRFIIDGDLAVGGVAHGSLRVEGGAELISGTTYIAGRSFAGVGITISGTDGKGNSSSWRNTGVVNTGTFNELDVIIENGAVANFGGLVTGLTGSGVDNIHVSGKSEIDEIYSRLYVDDYIIVARYGTANFNVSDGATVTVGADGTGTVYTGYGSSSNGSINIGAAAGSVAIGAGTINAATIEFGSDPERGLGSGTGTLVFNHTGTTEFTAGLVSANSHWDKHFLEHYAGDTTLSGDSSDFRGMSTISGGRLTVTDVLGGSAMVTGGTLAGSGTIGHGDGSLVTIASGGTLSPGIASSSGGPAIARLTIDGDLVFESGSAFVVEVDPNSTDGDLVHVTGNATIEGGSVAHIGADGSYRLNNIYTILAADEVLSGEFDGLTSSFAFLNPELLYDYDLGTVSLVFERNDSDFSSLALTPNQIATAGGIESMGFAPDHPVYEAMAFMPDDGDVVRYSLDQLSGEIHGSAKSALIEDSRFIRNAALQRIRAAFGNKATVNMPVLAYGEGGPQLAAATTDRAALWAHGFGAWNNFDSDGNAASLKSSTGGFLAGADAALGDWRVGMMAGFSHNSFRAAARNSAGSSDNYHLGLYGGTQWDQIALRGGLAYSWHKIETTRSVEIPNFSDYLSASYDAGTFQAFGELGYRYDMQDASFEPFVNLAHVSLHSDGYAEQGGAASLSSWGQTSAVTFTTLGLRGESAFDMGGTKATAHGMIGWRHAFGETPPLSTHGFDISDAFTIAGVPVAKNAAIIEAGLDFNLTPAATFGVRYQGQFGGGLSQNGFTANFAMSF